jgi:hypothetical protein
VFLRLSTLILAQLLDLVTFDVMVHRVGPEAEANPFVSDLFLAAGMPAVAVAKIALILLVGSLVVAAYGHGERRVWALVGGVPLALGISVGLIGGITNVATFLK